MAAILYFFIVILLFAISVKSFSSHNTRISKLTMILVFSTVCLIIGLMGEFLLSFDAMIFNTFMAIPYLFSLSLLYDYLVTNFEESNALTDFTNLFYMYIGLFFLTIIGLSAILGMTLFNYILAIDLLFDIINFTLLSASLFVLVRQMPKRISFFRLPELVLSFGLLVVSVIQVFIHTSLVNEFYNSSFVVFVLSVGIYSILRLYKDNQGLVPFSKEQVIENMEEMLVVVDNNDIIVDINKSFEETFDVNKTAIGMHIEEFMVTLPNISKDTYKKLVNEEETNLSFVDDNGIKTYSVKITEVYNQLNKPIGKMMLMYDISKLKEAMDYLEFIGNHDKLTKLYNRNFFEKTLVDIDTDNNLPISIILGDLNGLKIINDIFGHIKGDEFLIKISDILRQACIGTRSIISRTGGDEFCIILPNSEVEDAKQIVEQINLLVDTKLGNDMGTISLGIATKSSMNQKLEDIYREADSNMYLNKQKDEKNNKNLIIIAANKWLKSIPFESDIHIKNLEKLVTEFGHQLKLSEVMIEELKLLASLHDIGKFFIPEDILIKPSLLTDSEWKKIKQHSVQGFKIAASTEELSTIASGILSHHERWDGSGYPQGLKEEQIPYLARVFSVVEAYEVMTIGRPYKEALSTREALDELVSNSATQFDPNIVNAFVRMMLQNVD